MGLVLPQGTHERIRPGSTRKGRVGRRVLGTRPAISRGDSSGDINAGTGDNAVPGGRFSLSPAGRQPRYSLCTEVLRVHPPSAPDDTRGERRLLAYPSVGRLRCAHVGAKMLAMAAPGGSRLPRLASRTVAADQRYGARYPPIGSGLGSMPAGSVMIQIRTFCCAGEPMRIITSWLRPDPPGSCAGAALIPGSTG